MKNAHSAPPYLLAISWGHQLFCLLFIFGCALILSLGSSVLLLFGSSTLKICSFFPLLCHLPSEVSPISAWGTGALDGNVFEGTLTPRTALGGPKKVGANSLGCWWGGDWLWVGLGLMGNLACKLIMLCCQTARDYKMGRGQGWSLKFINLPSIFI